MNMMKKIFAMLLALVLLLSLAACTDTWYGDEKVDAYAFVITSTGNSYTLPAFTYHNDVWTNQARASKYAYKFYLEEFDTATIEFVCTACNYSETVENVSAPDALFFQCDCVLGDEDLDKPESLFINFILGTPPAEEVS